MTWPLLIGASGEIGQPWKAYCSMIPGRGEDEELLAGFFLEVDLAGVLVGIMTLGSWY